MPSETTTPSQLPCAPAAPCSSSFNGPPPMPTSSAAMEEQQQVPSSGKAKKDVRNDYSKFEGRFFKFAILLYATGIAWYAWSRAVQKRAA
mmetsp:Transcript_21455/g.24927  ORF Transcript_21455/g.24927 Transcript_21455/m.24927 type:complete len:90 (-) Transcript_21455:22-291(-)